MTNFLMFILVLIMGAIAYLLFIGIFVPQIAKNRLYAKLKAKEREELDIKLDLENYFGVKAVSENKKPLVK